MKSKVEIFASAKELATEKVDIPEWGGDVIVRTMTALERDRMELGWLNLARPDVAGYKAWIVAHTVMNGDGRFFDPATDFEQLCDMPADQINKAYEAASRLNAITKADQEELIKN